MSLRYFRRGSNNQAQAPPAPARAAPPPAPERTLRQVQPKPIENRIATPHWFDPEFYFNFYSDIKAYYGQVKPSELFAHYNEHGIKEKRFPSKHAMEAFSKPIVQPTPKEVVPEIPREDVPEPVLDKQVSIATADNVEAPAVQQLGSMLSKSKSVVNEINAVPLASSDSSMQDKSLNKILEKKSSFRAIRLQIPNQMNLDMRARKLKFTRPADVAPRLSIILITYNRIDCTLVCLESLCAIQHEVPFEILIWDNASTDQTVPVLKLIEGITLQQHSENLHFLRAVNNIAPSAKAPFTLLLNNDTQVAPGSLAAALDTFERHPACGIVGAKVILRATGKLQEAGSVFLSGHPHGYGRNENPQAPEFNFERPVPYCSGCSLLIRSELFRELGYFDMRYSPAYFEETDLCVRAQKQGHQIYYQPEFVVYHEEGASASKEYEPNSLMTKNGKLFRELHADFLAQLPTVMLEARSFRPLRKDRRILWCESELPDPLRGSGYPRMASLLSWLVRDGWHVTYHSIWGNPRLSSELPYGVEFFIKSDISLSQLIAQRPNYYGLAIISRTPTVQAYRHLVGDGLLSGKIPVIYDMETLAGLREIERAKYTNQTSKAKADSLLAEDISYCRSMSGVIVVSQAEQRYIQQAGIQRTFQLGHIVKVPEALPAYPFENRFGFVFVGFCDFEGSPNVDSMDWFVNQIFPLILAQIPNAILSIVGKVQDRLNKELAANPRIYLYGQVSNNQLNAVLDQHRVFIAPTRFASGIPHKCHMAACSGLPIVCTDLLAEQLGWSEDVVLSAPRETRAFAEACIRLHSSQSLWLRQQTAALEAVRRDCSPEQMFGFRDWLLKFSSEAK